MIGVDPGIANLGIGVVAESRLGVRLVEVRLVKTPRAAPTGERLAEVAAALRSVLERHRPSALVVEAQYFHRQRETAVKLGMAAGVCLLAAQEAGVPVFEYGPMAVKQALVGNGRAAKAQVEFMVKAQLGLRLPIESTHLADALALALTHLQSRRIRAATGALRGKAAGGRGLPDRAR